MDQPPTVTGTSNMGIEVLREMVRLAENRRAEELKWVDRLNKYNLALIAFNGSFLSLMITTGLQPLIVRSSGCLSLLSVLSSLIAVFPQTIKHSAISIQSDIERLQEGVDLSLQNYLLEEAIITDTAATRIAAFAVKRRKWTVVAASFLAFALLVTYSMYAYA